jgi:diguanylate cyclase (GGDEF)-like protein
MYFARRAVFSRGMPRVRHWILWSLPVRQLALWTVVMCGYLAWLGARAAAFTVRPTDLALFAALLGCGAFTVELTRRTAARGVVSKDVYAVWELPVVFLLPGLYALIVPVLRLTLTQCRVLQAPVYKRGYTAAAIGISYGCARMLYMGLLPDGTDPRTFLWNHTALWLAAAGAGAVAQWAVNLALIAAVFKLENPDASLRRDLLSREMLHNDATEVCAALLVAVGMTISAFTLVVALPLATLLQRSFRHAQLLTEARADAKTGLLNAATWDREAIAEVARAVRTGTPLAVALLDLDRFKQVNDTRGHLAGDVVLRRVADTMTSVLREYDLAGRFGGEEFVMLLPQTRAVDAFRIAERVRERIARLPVTVPGGEPVNVTVSIGVAALDAGSRRELPDLLAAADAALYRAKASGRNQVQMISTSRGLSAVRPCADPHEGACGAWRAAPPAAKTAASGSGGAAVHAGASAHGSAGVHGSAAAHGGPTAHGGPAAHGSAAVHGGAAPHGSGLAHGGTAGQADAALHGGAVCHSGEVVQLSVDPAANRVAGEDPGDTGSTATTSALAV